MTKKEVVSALRKRFTEWCRLLPDVEYKSCNDNSEFYDNDGSVNGLHVIELGAEEEEGARNENA